MPGARLKFEALRPSGDNYHWWTLNVHLLLGEHRVSRCIMPYNSMSQTDKLRGTLLLHRHMCPTLVKEYISLKDPYDLWVALKYRFDHNRENLLPKAKKEWAQLRLQDCRSVREYDMKLTRIYMDLKVCDEDISDADLLEKTYATAPPHLQIHTKYKKYIDLLVALLSAERINEMTSWWPMESIGNDNDDHSD